MRTIVFVFLLLSLSVLSHTQVATLQADSSPAAAEVQKLDLDLAKLMVQEKWDEYASYLAEDFVRTSSDGSLETKKDVLADLRSGKDKILDVMPEELAIHAYGDTAILTGHLSVVARRNGRVNTAFSRITEVFVKRDGRWFLVATQSTAVNH